MQPEVNLTGLPEVFAPGQKIMLLNQNSQFSNPQITVFPSQPHIYWKVVCVICLDEERQLYPTILAEMLRTVTEGLY